MAKQCPVCTAVNDDDAEFCAECGIGFGLAGSVDAGAPAEEAAPAPQPATGGPPVRPQIGFIANLKAVPTSWRWIGLGIVLVFVALIAFNLLRSDGGGDEAPDTSVPLPTTESTTSTTAAPTTEPILTEEDLYREIEAELLRACDAAVVERNEPEVTFDPRWSAVSTPEALLRAAQECVDARRAEQGTGSDADEDVDEATTTTTEG